jgi:oligoribonuclease
MADDNALLVWMDLEMSGLEVERERILEIAAVITDAELNVVAEGPDLIVHQPEAVLAAMDDWNREHHAASGLADRVRASTITEEQAEAQIVAFLSAHCAPQTAPLCGNTIHQDRRFLRKYMPSIDAFLHYRIVDVTTVKEVTKRWYPTLFETRPKKDSKHRALEDIRESIAELRWYRQNVFK